MKIIDGVKDRTRLPAIALLDMPFSSFPSPRRREEGLGGNTEKMP
jgi:hypothetical protein